jgi:hypothetical protein
VTTRLKGKYASFADKHLFITNVSGYEVMARCPYHENAHNSTFQFNTESGLFVCFSGKCGARGGIKALERHFGIRVAEDMIDVRDLRARIDVLRKGDKAEVLPVLPESSLTRYRFPSGYWGPCPDSVASKGRLRGCTGHVGCPHHRWLKPSTIASFDLGADPMGEYVTIPLRNTRGELLGVIKRYLDVPEDGLKYRYPKGFARNQNLFASWLVAEDDDAHTVVLVEGSIDAMMIWQAGFPAMAIYGSSISASQVRILRRLGITKVILMFDADEAGKKVVRSCRGWKQRLRGGQVKWEYDPTTDLRREFLVEVAGNFPRGVKDPGGMTKRQIRAAISTARKIA